MNLEEIRVYRNQINPFARKLGIECTELDLHYAKTEMKVTEDLRNPQGAVHGGVLYTLADIAGGTACAACGEQIATLDSDFHFLRAGLQLTELTAVARELKRGKRICVYNIEVTDQNGTVLAAGTFTYSTLGRPLLPTPPQRSEDHAPSVPPS